MSDPMRRQYRPLTDGEKASLDNMKTQAEMLWAFFDSFGESRELSLAKTNLEQAVMWATKHLTG